MHESYTVSVVIPTRNRAHLLTRALESVLNQSRRPDEVLVVDDASSEDIRNAVMAWSKDVRVIRSDRNIERGAARNLGAREARGQLLAFLDSDDYWQPTKLERQLEVAGGHVASVTGIDMVDSEGRIVRSHYVPPNDAGARILERNLYLGGPSSLLIPKDLFFAVGGFEQRWAVQGSEDWLLFAKLMRLGHRVAVVPEPLVVYLVHSANSTADPDRVAVSMWTAVEYLRHEGRVTGAVLQRLRADTARLIAGGFAARGRFREAQAWTARALRAGTPGDGLQTLVRVSRSAIGGGMLRRLGLRRAI